MREYYRSVNIARGIGMFLVVLGHSISDTVYFNSFFKYIFLLIYSFHMPLFFFISGFCAVKIFSKVTLSEKLDFIYTRFKRLMIPYFFVGVMYIPIKIFASDFMTKQFDLSEFFLNFLLGENPHSQLWTLYALFVVSVLVIIFKSSDKTKNKLFFIFSLIIALLSTFLPSCILQNIMLEFFFFTCGCFLAKDKNFKQIPMSFSIFIISIISLVLLNFIFEIHGDNSLKIVTGLTGIYLVCFISKHLEKKNYIFFDIIGNYSIDIYILANIFQVSVRVIFLNKLGFSPYFCLLLSILFGILFPIVISKLFVRKSKYLSILILGNCR